MKKILLAFVWLALMIGTSESTNAHVTQSPTKKAVAKTGTAKKIGQKKHHAKAISKKASVTAKKPSAAVSSKGKSTDRQKAVASKKGSAKTTNPRPVPLSPEEKMWKDTIASKSPVDALRFYRAFPNSNLITVSDGSVSSSMSMTIGNLSSNGTGTVSSSGISVTIDGQEFDWGDDDTERLGLVTFHNTAEGYRTVSTLREQKAKVIRDKATGKVLSVDLGNKL